MIERCAGILVPLFSLRSANDLGRGDFAGLAPLGEFALAMGHCLIQLLPIDEMAAGETSPYSALSIFALDPIYISSALLPGIDHQSIAAARAAFSGKERAVDQVRLRTVKSELLRQSYMQFKSRGDRRLRDEFKEFITEHRGWLDDYTTFRALKGKFVDAEWEKWPDELKRHEPVAIADARRSLSAEIELLEYGQFIAHQQWRSAREYLRRRGVILGGDLSFSPARQSAEVWAHQELFDLRRSVGAPPDAFSPTGQRWGLPMPYWERMRGDNFEFIRMRVRHARSLYDVVRIDHVVGLYRTYGYPIGDDTGGEFDPIAESAQRAQGPEILKVMLEEAAPMQLIAEDLGVIPPFVRETLATLGIPAYKVVRWEKIAATRSAIRDTGENVEHYVNPSDYPAVAMATTGTHDTEPLSQWWAEIGSDERRRFATDLRISEEVDSTSAILQQSALDAILRVVYASPAELVITPLPDLFGWNVRINFPGTVSDANWTWRLPFELERVMDDPALRERMEQIRVICERTGRFHRPARSC